MRKGRAQFSGGVIATRCLIARMFA